MKDELGWKIMMTFARLRAKTYSYLIDEGGKDKKQRHKKSVIKRKRKFENDKNYFQATQLEKKMNYPEKIKLTWVVLRKKVKKNS